ncbi:hypothetical protein Tco_0274393 [Tanacetum coccineum]
MIKSASYDYGVLFLEEASSDDCSVEETEDLGKVSLVSTHDENEGEKEEFDEVEDGSGWMGYKGFGISSYELFKMQHGHTIKVTEMELDVNKDEIMRWKLVKSRPKKKVKFRY